MAFEDNELLFDADKTSRIVAIELGEIGTVKVYRRERDGSTAVDVEPFHPFVWTDGDITDLGLENTQKLAGDLRYNWLVTVDSWKELIALRNGLKKTGRSFFALSDPVQHYLSASGRTLFKQLPFEELKRVQLEVLSPTGESDLADASQNPIASIALSDNSGWEQLIVVDPENAEESERDALKQLTALIKERDPDVIEGHDLFRFDLPYLVARARKTKVNLDWGRSGGFLRSRPSRLQIAEKTIDYPKFQVDGRHFVDTFLLAQFYDVGMRALSGFERNVWHCDVASLYPSIMLQFGCFPVTDQLQIFRHLLTDLRSFRLEAKGQMQLASKEGNRGEWHHLHALQNTFKILINSFYGYLGFAQGHFADFDAAARVTQIGRDLLQKMIAWLQEHGAQVIEVDTDGIYFVPPSSVAAGVSPAKPKSQ